MEMQEKKTPSVEQVMEYRTWLSKLTDESIAKITAFEQEYNVFTQAFEENGRYGVKDACGEVLVPALFDDIASTFKDECRKWAVPVVNGGKMALVAPDGKGTLRTPFEYDKIHFYECYYYLIKDDRMGLSSVGGHILVPAKMDKVYEPFNDLIVFAKDGKYGFSMLGSDVITEAIYDDYEVGDDEYLIVVKDGVRGYLDEEGHFTTESDDRFFYAGCCL